MFAPAVRRWRPILPLVWGAGASAAAWIDGVPASPSAQRDVTLTVGGPGLFAFRYRVNGGPWSAPLDIGQGFDPQGTVRTGQIPSARGWPTGNTRVEVQGRDFAGNWQTTPTVSDDLDRHRRTGSDRHQ